MRLRTVVLAFAVCLAAGAALAASPCIGVGLEPAPSRFTGVSWDWDYTQLLVLDVASGELRTYTTGGTIAKHWANPGSGPFEFSQPLLLVRGESGFVLQDGGYHFIELDRSLNPVASHDLSGDAPGSDGSKGGSLHWVPTGDGIVGYGSVQEPGRPWKVGLLKVTWSPAVRFQLLRALADEDRAQQPFVLGVGTSAACKGRAYQLAFGEDYGVFEVSGTDTRLRRGLPKQFGRLPELPASRGMANGAERFIAIAATTGAAHLVSDGSALFVVLRDTRSPARRWLLARYDPEAELVTGAWLLPSSALDVHLAPGPKRWALLEVAGRTSDGGMTAGRLMLFPAEALAGAGGTVDAPVPVCAR